MKYLKTLFKITSVLSLATLIMSIKTRATGFSQIKNLEYYLRWNHDKFKQHYAWRLIPPANAELPPRHQKAFALKIWPNHRKKTIVIHYDEQKVTDDKSHRSGKLKLTATDYDELAKIMTQPIVSTCKIEKGWVGPSPAYLKILSTASELFIFASTSPKGPAGPTRAVSEKGERLYLCNTELHDWLKTQIQAALKTKGCSHDSV